LKYARSLLKLVEFDEDSGCVGLLYGSANIYSIIRYVQVDYNNLRETLNRLEDAVKEAN